MGTLFGFGTERLHRRADPGAFVIGPLSPFSVWKFSSDRMKATVLRAREQFQVFNSIIAPIFVLVVNMLASLKQAPEMALHNKAMLQNIAVCIGLWMLWHQDANIAAFINEPALLGSGKSSAAAVFFVLLGSWINASGQWEVSV